MNVNLRQLLRGALSRLTDAPVDRRLTAGRALLSPIAALEPGLVDASDADLAREVADLRGRLPRSGPTGPDDLVGAFALVREVAHRDIGLRMHDAQVLAGLALHEGKVVEMATGEGKTLAAVAPAWLASLAGRGVHVLTVNDYLARRDAAWMGPVYERLGVRVGCIQEGMARAERRQAYRCDVTYGTAKEMGFDFLRDQLVLEADDLVHRSFHHALVDEADFLMIDEARVPMVIAGGSTGPPVDPGRFPELVRRLEGGRDHEVDENLRNVSLTVAGLTRVERALGVASLHDPEHRDLLATLNLALHAELLIRRDVEYLVTDGAIEVVDELTGRVVEDRRWPDGLHPALEAKEGLEIRPEGHVLGAIPVQHYLRLYPTLCGMTATATPGAEELRATYGLEVAVIPSHRECVRRDESDILFSDSASKQGALVDEVRRVHAQGRPVLVGTASVKESEALAERLRDAGLDCTVLNARNDEEEARVIAEAGRRGAITVSTNMAGRGTDIRLGGSDEADREAVADLGGLHVIGTNRHESQRIDDQLRGRAGRQGDPGSSRFLVSLADDLVRRFGHAVAVEELRTTLPAGEIDEPAVLAEMERAQRVVDGQNFDIRQTLWRYTELVEEQRRIVGALRHRALREPAALDLLARRCPEGRAELCRQSDEAFVRRVEQRLTLLQLDHCWADHLARVADIREAIPLAALTGQDTFGGLWTLRQTPVQRFRQEIVQVFGELQPRLEQGIVDRFEALEWTDGRLDLERDDLSGPESTWTYLTTDTPFESTIIRMFRSWRRERSK